MRATLLHKPRTRQTWFEFSLVTSVVICSPHPLGSLVTYPPVGLDQPRDVKLGGVSLVWVTNDARTLHAGGERRVTHVGCRSQTTLCVSGAARRAPPTRVTAARTRANVAVIDRPARVV